MYDNNTFMPLCSEVLRCINGDSKDKNKQENSMRMIKPLAMALGLSMSFGVLADTQIKIDALRLEKSGVFA